jgi:hypothetical protein
LTFRNRSENLKIRLNEAAWSPAKNGWLANPAFPEKVTRHANFLAVVSGLASESQSDGIRWILADDQTDAVGTPYMAGFENMAISRQGDIPYMLKRTLDSWGGMLREGATTFWEAWDPAQHGKEQYEFYGRPYAKSLCHAWSAGPAAFLPAGILGLKPLEDGWKRFSLNPQPGTLTWVNSTVPTPYGNIQVDVDSAGVKLTVPAGTLAEWNGEQFRGPLTVTRKR